MMPKQVKNRKCSWNSKLEASYIALNHHTETWEKVTHKKYDQVLYLHCYFSLYIYIYIYIYEYFNAYIYIYI